MIAKDIILIAGDTQTLTVKVEANGQPVDLSGAKIWMTAKERPEFIDPVTPGPGGFQVSTTTGEITAATPASGIATILLSSALTKVLVPGFLVYDIQVLEANGTLSTVVKGTVGIAPRVTGAVS